MTPGSSFMRCSATSAQRSSAPTCRRRPRSSRRVSSSQVSRTLKMRPAEPSSTSSGSPLGNAGPRLPTPSPRPRLAYCSERGLDYWHLSLALADARLRSTAGIGIEAAESATGSFAPVFGARPRRSCRRDPGAHSSPSRDPDRLAAADAALAEAEPTGELQQIPPWPQPEPRPPGSKAYRESIAATDPTLTLGLERLPSWASAKSPFGAVARRPRDIVAEAAEP